MATGKNKPKRLDRARSWRVARRKREQAKLVSGVKRTRKKREKKKGSNESLTEKIVVEKKVVKKVAKKPAKTESKE